MSTAKCCVPGCLTSSNSSISLHKFPNPEKDKERFNTWLYLIGGDIMGLENIHIFKYRRICSLHFEEKYFCRNNRLSNIAIPDINMPGTSLIKFAFNEAQLLRPVRNVTLGASISKDVLYEQQLIYSSEPAAVKQHLITPQQQAKTQHINENFSSHVGIGSTPPRFSSWSFSFTMDWEMPKSVPLSSQDEGEMVLEANSQPEMPKSVPFSRQEEGELVLEADSQPEMPKSVPFSWQEEGELVLEADSQPDFFEEHLIDSEEFTWQSKGDSKPESEQSESRVRDRSEVHRAEPTEADCHSGYRCNTCLAQIAGFRYVCVQCLDWDLCGACEARGAHPHHYVLRIPAQRPRDEVRTTLRTIRRILADDIIHLSDTVPEIKEEEECLEDPIEVDRSRDTDHTTAPHPKHKSSESELNTSFEQECSSSDREESQSDRNEAESNVDSAERPACVDESSMDSAESPAFIDESNMDAAGIDSMTDFEQGVAEVPSVPAIDTRPLSSPLSSACDRTLPHTDEFKTSPLVLNFKQQGAVGIPRSYPAAETKPFKVTVQRNSLLRIPPTVRIPLKQGAVGIPRSHPAAEKTPLKVTVQRNSLLRIPPTVRIPLKQGAVGIPRSHPAAEKTPLKVTVQRNSLLRIPPTVRIPLKQAIVVLERLNETPNHTYKPRPPPDNYTPGTHTHSQGVHDERKRRNEYADASEIGVKQQRTSHHAIYTATRARKDI